MSDLNPSDRANWNSKLGFVLAAAGSAVGLGNIWGFPTQVADNGGAAFILIYLLCCACIGLPVMIAEFTIGRKTQRNPVGAFKALGKGNPFIPFIGYWGVLCGVMILAFYVVLSGWTLAYVVEEFAWFLGGETAGTLLGDLSHGGKNSLFTLLFMLLTILIVTGGVNKGIERATKLLMPALFLLLAVMIGYILTLEGSYEGLLMYLKPDFSTVNADLILSALGQAFFSLSLGMGALITYGSYLDKQQNLIESAVYVTLVDVGVAFSAGMLVIPAMFVAQYGGTEIFDPKTGALFSSITLVFDVLPQLFHQIGGILGLLSGVTFFVLLSLAALTSSISLLEVPVSYVIDEFSIRRKKAVWMVGGVVSLIAVVISFDTSLIDHFVIIFNEFGLPFGGLMICLFLGWFWKTENAVLEISNGFENADKHWSIFLWSVFIRFVCPVLIALVLTTTLLNIFR